MNNFSQLFIYLFPIGGALQLLMYFVSLYLLLFAYYLSLSNISTSTLFRYVVLVSLKSFFTNMSISNRV